MEGVSGFLLGIAGGFFKSLASDGIDDAYDQEVHDPAHSGEDVPTHMGHAIGRFLGIIVTGGQ